MSLIICIDYDAIAQGVTRGDLDLRHLLHAIATECDDEEELVDLVSSHGPDDPMNEVLTALIELRKEHGA